MTESTGERLLDIGQQGAVSTEMMAWFVGSVLVLALTFPLWKYLLPGTPPDSGRRRRR